MLSDALLARLRELDAAAERGPWKTRYNHLRVYKAYSDQREVWPLSHEDVVDSRHMDRLRRNATLIAEMRSALPDLLEEIRSQRSAVENLMRERDAALQRISDLEVDRDSWKAAAAKLHADLTAAHLEAERRAASGDR